MIIGLTSVQIKEQTAAGRVHRIESRTSRSYGDILRANICTRFNAILLGLFVLILIFGRAPDALFIVIIGANALIGIIQEVRAKHTLDRLVIANRPKVRVIRDGMHQEITTGEIVQGETIELMRGDQVIVDGTVLLAHDLEVDESLLSGESAPIIKKLGDSVLSGSFIIAGSGIMQVTKISNETYAQKLTAEARCFKLTPSEIMIGINTFLHYVSIAMCVVAPIVFFSQYYTSTSLYHAVPSLVAVLVGMVPQGLVLMTSIAFAISTITLGRKSILVQELAAVEGLARIDTICFDKTGTLTTGKLQLSRIVPLSDAYDHKKILSAFADPESIRELPKALAAALPHDIHEASHTIIPFSSSRGWEVLDIDNTLWAMGSPEALLGIDATMSNLRDEAKSIADKGYRLVVLGIGTIQAQHLTRFIPNAFILFEEEVRHDVQKTLNYFKEQQVTVHIISGDSRNTVIALAKRAGVDDDTHIFGRIGPREKMEMIKTLQEKGRVVAMVGDGVNDVLALKQADLGIAMGTGTPAAKAVSAVILLHSNFEAVPLLLTEGRKVFANMERVANLFISKSVYVTLLAILSSVLFVRFPFLPRHFSLIDVLTIGIPAFFLTFTPQAKRHQTGFMYRVVRFSGISGSAAALCTMFVILFTTHVTIVHDRTVSTIAVITLGAFGFYILSFIAQPPLWRTTVLQYSLISVFFSAFYFPSTRQFFAFELPQVSVMITTLCISFLGSALMSSALLYFHIPANRK